MIRNAFVVVVLLGSCGVASREEGTSENLRNVEYASTFHFETSGTDEYLVVDEPWPKSTEKKKYELTRPLKRVVCTSTSHLPFFELLGMEEVVLGFPNFNYISSEVFLDRASKGLITDLGPDGNLNLELLLSLEPDAVIAFDAGGESKNLYKIQELGIPVIYNSDFLEKTALGRAEWIKAIGALLGKKQKADSIFSTIEAEYLRLKKLGKQSEDKPSILSGVVYGDTWFLPGGKNWAASFFENAGGKYIWESDTTSGWLELSFEAVYEQGNAADFWIGTSTFETKKEMTGQENRYSSFKAYKEDRVYNYTKKKGPNGGIDFFESAYARPDLVLSDLIKILHPELLPEYETVYFKKLE